MQFWSRKADSTARVTPSKRRRALRLEALEPRRMLAVVINEIHYNSEDNTVAEEFIELHNTGSSSVDLSGWEFTDGITYTFNQGQQIPGGGYIVVAQDPAVALEEFGVTTLGPYSGNLSSDGERVELRNAQGSLIDVVDYRVGFPWPIAASGEGGSMELINPSLDNNLGSSWRSSFVPDLFPSEPDDGGGAADALGDLAHRWSFSGDLTDSVGGAHGTLINPSGGAFYNNGQLDLSSANSGQRSDQSSFNDGAYVDLPNGIISSLSDSATFEWWGTVDRNRVWAEVFSFGTSQGGEDQSTGGVGQDYIILIPEAAFNGGPLRASHRDGSSNVESFVDRSGPLPEDVEQHLAVVWDGVANTQTLYANGQLIGSSNTLIDLSDLNDVNNWLGRSNWNDPLFDGLYNEFRVYNRALSDIEIADSFSDGPDATLDSPGINFFQVDDSEILLGQNATLSWDVINFSAIAINQGIGDVTGQTQIVVSPSETTTYTLTATNNDGQSTRMVTVGVTVPKTTPGMQNNSYLTNAAPNIRQVSHTPSPSSSDDGVVTAKVTDPNGVGSVELQYQIVLPGQYIPARLPVPRSELLANGDAPTTPNPAYFSAANWTTLVMVDNGTGGDAVAGDDIYTATIPAQSHRTLVRYRIAMEDSLGAIDVAPFADDQSLNFAYFVYDGVPEYRDNSGNLLADQATLATAPTYHFLTRGEDMEDVLAYSSSDEIPQFTDARFAYNWGGTMVYNGVVYDNIKYRLRGANGRYLADGKRSMRFRFNEGSYFEALDQYGNPYPEAWRTLTTGKGFDNHSTLTYGLNEAVTLMMSNLLGVPASNTHYFNFRVIDDVDESPDQWRGDFWGLNFALETYDKRFLDAHGLEKGNLYKLINQSTDALRQQRYQSADAVSDGSDHDYIENLLTRSSDDIEARVNLEKYYLFHALVESVRHYDFWPSSNKNMVYYFEPDYQPENGELGKLWLLPWDTDASWGPSWNEGKDVVYDAIFENNDATYRDQLLKPEYWNTLREVRDLLWQPDQLEGIIKELASTLLPLEAADRARWQNAPNDAGNYDGLGGAGASSISNLIDDMLAFAFAGGNWPHGGAGTGFVQSGGRAAYLDDQLSSSGEEALIPFTPTISYVGSPGFEADSLAFQTTPFSDPQGSGSFAAMQWRIADVTNVAAGLDPSVKFKDEWTANWDSGPLTTFSSTIAPPLTAVQPGELNRARVRFQDDTGRWSHWSSPIEFVPTEANQVPLIADHLRISELNYHAHDGLPQFGDDNLDGDDFDFLELVNTSATQTLFLEGVQLAGGVTYTFGPSDQIAPGGRILVVEDVSNFESRYGTALPVAGKWSGALRNSGEELMLLASDQSVVQQFTYSDNWHSRTDGRGSSLVVLDTEGNYDSGSNWRSSTAFGGTPGTAEIDVIDVVVNEVLANSDLPAIDTIELMNVTSSEVEISGWWISDSSDNLFKYQVSTTTTLAAGGYRVFDESDFNAGGGTGIDDFLLSSGGDDVWLLAAGDGGKPERFADVVHFDATRSGVSLGRVPDGVTSYDLFPLATPSFGSMNGSHEIPIVLISEVHYHPVAPSPGGTITELQLEFIELYNPDSVSVDLTGWRLRGGADFDFLSGTTIAASETLVLVNFDPSNTTLASEFRSHYGMDVAAPLLGPLVGQLDNGSEVVKLLAPTPPPDGDPGPVFYLVDRVGYEDQSPWPTSADGGGDALTRSTSTSFGDFATSWNAGTPTPGSVPFAPAFRADFNSDGWVNAADYTVWRDSLGQSVAVYSGADASGNGLIDQPDYLIWRQNFGAEVTLPSVASQTYQVAAGSGATSTELSTRIPIPTSATTNINEGTSSEIVPFSPTVLSTERGNVRMHHLAPSEAAVPFDEALLLLLSQNDFKEQDERHLLDETPAIDQQPSEQSFTLRSAFDNWGL